MALRVALTSPKERNCSIGGAVNSGFGGAGKMDMSPAAGGVGDIAFNLGGKALAVGLGFGGCGRIESAMVYTTLDR